MFRVTRMEDLRVLLVDDHPLFRQALATTARQIRSDIRIDEFDTLADARAALDPAGTALVLLDLKLPDAQGVAGLLALKAHAPDALVAIVSATDDADTVLTVQACGAVGFISKAAGVEELCAAMVLDSFGPSEPRFQVALPPAMLAAFGSESVAAKSLLTRSLTTTFSSVASVKLLTL